MTIGWIRLAAGLLTAVSLGSPLHGHGVHPYEPTPEEMDSVTPPIKGAFEFAADLSRNGRFLFTKQENVVLSKVIEDFDIVRHQKRENPSHKDIPRYHHHRAEQTLLGLLENSKGLVVHDFAGGPSTPKEEPLRLSGQQDMVLIKVVTGDEETRFVVVEENLRDNEMLMPWARICERGTTYVALRFKDIPNDQSHLTMTYRAGSAEGPTHATLLPIIKERPGNLKLKVLDEHGAVTPVYIRLEAKETKRLFEPPSALDFREQLNEITGGDYYGPGRAYVAPSRGRLTGPFWVIRGEIDAAIPPGEWALTILHGPEYVPVEQTLAVKAGEITAETLRLKRWINFRERGWFSGDDHVHARLMSKADADNLMAFTEAADLNVTNILEMGDSARTWYEQRGYGKDFNVRRGDRELVIGQEDPRSFLGHAIGMNLPSMVRDLDKYLLNDLIAQEIHEKGGLYGHTHVGANACFVHREMALFTPMDVVDFNSIIQRKLGLELYYDFLNMGFEMTASAGSDTPYGAVVGTSRVYTRIGPDVSFTSQGWFDALKAGRSFATNGPLVEFTVDGKLPGEVITVIKDRKLKVVATGYGAPGYAAPKEVRIVVLGETHASEVSSDPQRRELRVESEIDSGHGAWVAAHVIGHDGTEAHTTPVYVLREGFRHWNVGKAGPALDRQLAVLDEIDVELEKAKNAYRTNPHSMWDRWMVEQGDAVRERTGRIRQVYQNLKTTLVEERKARRHGDR